MRDMGISVPRGKIAATPEEAYQAAKIFREWSGDVDILVKAQVQAGGRGLGHFDSGLKGGIQVCATPEEVRDVTAKMLDHKLITKQTGPEGKLCKQVYLAERAYVRRETYLAFLMDRKSCGPLIVGSARGGTDIETLSAENPDAIFKIPVNIDTGITPEIAEEVAVKLGFNTPKIKMQTIDQITRLYNLFIKYDCTLVEVNPLIEDSYGKIISLDAKINFDDNAEFRQKAIFASRDESQIDPREAAAAKADLSYIQLEGNIGCLVNGAGLAMATMDIIKNTGGQPANFLDVGGGATEKQVTEAFRILSTDKNVKVILVNIFGGIMRCDVIALGIINAAKTLDLKIPLVVRLKGTNVEEAKDILESSGLRVIAADDLDDAAQKAVKVTNIIEMARQAKLTVSFELPL